MKNQKEYQPKTGQPCHCRPGQARDNCPACEGTGMRIDFAAIRARPLALTVEAHLQRYANTLNAESNERLIARQRAQWDIGSAEEREAMLAQCVPITTLKDRAEVISFLLDCESNYQHGKTVVDLDEVSSGFDLPA